MDFIVTNEMDIWIAGGISLWEINRFVLELDRQIDHTPQCCSLRGSTSRLSAFLDRKAPNRNFVRKYR